MHQEAELRLKRQAEREKVSLEEMFNPKLFGKKKIRNKRKEIELEKPIKNIWDGYKAKGQEMKNVILFNKRKKGVPRQKTKKQI